MVEKAKDLIEKLNIADECTSIEAKKGSSVGKSILETVCSFSNEPGLGGGIILLGVEKDEKSMLFPYYQAVGVKEIDKITNDLTSQCASVFNMAVRPEIEAEDLGKGIVVIKVKVSELPNAQKPLYFKSESLPRGAFRRIGSSDQKCSDDDLHIFFHTEDSFDCSIVNDSSLDDISEEAIDLYRTLRKRVNEFAEELNYENEELLLSLGAAKIIDKKYVLTYTGLLVFGKRSSLRRLLPMVRVDYIRINGTVWVNNPENRFTTVDMRGPLIELLQRSFSAIADDLPQGFLLPEGKIQAEAVGLPTKVLREALVNAFIHRSYRINEPIQIIRYSNRIEIINPGFSLKLEEQFGEPGSRNRNPYIAAIFHETNLAETKGSGIRTMRNLMDIAQMAPPTFESDHSANRFTARLLLHHFLSEEDLQWLAQFESFNLSDSQKRGMVYLKESWNIDNSTYRQLNGFDILTASSELRELRNYNLIKQQGKGRSTFYVPGPVWFKDFITYEDSNPFDLTLASNKNDNEVNETYPISMESAPVTGESAPVTGGSAPVTGGSAPVTGGSAPVTGESAPVIGESAPVTEESAPVSFGENQLNEGSPGVYVSHPTPPLNKQLYDTLPENLKSKVINLPMRITDPERLNSLIIELCNWRPLSISDIAGLLQRTEKYLLRNNITELKNKGRLKYLYDEPNHPDQKYVTVQNK